MLYQDFDSGLNEARTHHGVEHNFASAHPVPSIPAAGVEGTVFRWIPAPRSAAVVMTSPG